jgi:hypothetical protein
MSIEKFKTFDDASQALWNYHPDAEYYQQVMNLYKLYSKLSKFKYPQGIFKFKTFEEAEEHKMQCIIDSANNNRETNSL